MQKMWLTISSSQTKRLGKSLAGALLKGRPKNRALVIGLEGDLGGGKTTFLQGFARGCGAMGRILSPTFIIIRRAGNFYHIDCYRLRGSQELLELGFKKIIAEPKNIVVVEWADRVKRIIPRGAIWINFEFVDKNKRKITIKLKDEK